MARIFTGVGRAASARVVDPVARGLLRLGVSPDAVTVAGTAGVLVGTIGFAARGEFLVGALIALGFVLVDVVDGAMARARGYSTRFGALLDSTMDRIADGAVFGSIAYWYASQDELPTLAAALLCLVTAQVISYVKARAQGLGIECDVGIAERAERLTLVGLGALATGVGVGWALPVALWLLVPLCLVTVGQRVLHVRRATMPDRPEAGMRRSRP